MVSRGALREYLRGSLWVLPTLSVLAALAAGAVLASVSVGPRSPLAFQGTPDDARTLLLGITGTMITIIALLLGLAVVALQLSSTQFSPRLLRNFLRDRPNQVVLSAFVATFAYSAAGLYTVGVSGGNRTAAFPRLAISGAIVLLFASLGLLVFFADHLLHSIQVDAIMETVQRNTLAVIQDGLLAGGQEAPEVPDWAVPVVSRRSGYVQAVRPQTLLPCAARHGACLRVRLRVGDHVARSGQGVVIVPARRFGDYLAVMCGLIRRYGASEPTVAHALLRLLGNCAAVAGDDPERRAAIEEQARLIVSDAEREVAQPADLVLARAEAESVLQAVARRPPR